MTIAKGRTDCEVERDTVVQRFNDLIRVLKQSKNRAEEYAKASLYDITNDKSISNEEQRSLARPFYDLLSVQEETDIRIRNIILIGMFSFWELSLMDICANYPIDVVAAKGVKPRKDNARKNDKTHYSENDYLNAIFPFGRPENVGMISSQLKEFRNYLTHGSANDGRHDAIKKLISTHPEFCVTKMQDSYHITSYDGLEQILETINDALICAETTAKTLKCNQNH